MQAVQKPAHDVWDEKLKKSAASRERMRGCGLFPDFWVARRSLVCLRSAPAMLSCGFLLRNRGEVARSTNSLLAP